MKESDLMRFAQDYLARTSLVWWRQPGGGVAHSVGGQIRYKKNPMKGFPDLAGLTPSGKLWTIEVKTAKGRLSPEQEVWRKRINDSGGLAMVARSLDEIAKHIQEFLKS